MLRKSGLLAMPAVLMTIVLTASLSLLTFHFRTILLDSYQTKLEQVAEITSRILRDDIEAHGDNHLSFSLLATDIGSSSGLRVTLVNESGTVVGDSKVAEHDLDQMDNHASRSEIKTAMEKGQGLSKRFSSTLGYDLMYYATKVSVKASHSSDHNHGVATAHEDKSEIYVVRTALPLNIFEQQLLWIWLWVAGISILGVFVVIMIARFFSTMLDKQSAREREALAGEVKERTHELSLMQRLGSLMSACTTVDSAANVVHPIAGHLLPGCCGGAITLIKSSRNRLDILTQWGDQW